MRMKVYVLNPQNNQWEKRVDYTIGDDAPKLGGTVVQNNRQGMRTLQQFRQTVFDNLTQINQNPLPVRRPSPNGTQSNITIKDRLRGR